jgi:N-acetylmuramoyl-L-alanine amidase
LVVSNLRGKVPLAKDPNRSAAFKVLKQPETPAVLIELGYMSNAEDLARLSRPEGQRQLATAIAASVDGYFAKRDARGGR